MIELSSIDRRAFVAALVAAALAPGWQHNRLTESEDAAAKRLAHCALTIANEIVDHLQPAEFPAGVAASNPRWADVPF